MSRLTRQDYINVLKFYNKPIPKEFQYIKNDVLEILSNKLCRCIKKVKRSKKTENEAIGICKKSVLHTKKIDIYRFKCKKKARFLPKRKTQKYLKKKLY